MLWGRLFTSRKLPDPPPAGEGVQWQRVLDLFDSMVDPLGKLGFTRGSEAMVKRNHWSNQKRDPGLDY